MSRSFDSVLGNLRKRVAALEKELTTHKVENAEILRVMESFQNNFSEAFNKSSKAIPSILQRIKSSERKFDDLKFEDAGEEEVEDGWLSVKVPRKGLGE